MTRTTAFYATPSSGLIPIRVDNVLSFRCHCKRFQLLLVICYTFLRSVVCLSVVCLSQSCTLLEPFDGFRCHLQETSFRGPGPDPHAEFTVLPKPFSWWGGARCPPPRTCPGLCFSGLDFRPKVVRPLGPCWPLLQKFLHPPLPNILPSVMVNVDTKGELELKIL